MAEAEAATSQRGTLGILQTCWVNGDVTPRKHSPFQNKRKGGKEERWERTPARLLMLAFLPSLTHRHGRRFPPNSGLLTFGQTSGSGQ